MLPRSGEVPATINYLDANTVVFCPILGSLQQSVELLSDLFYRSGIIRMHKHCGHEILFVPGPIFKRLFYKTGESLGVSNPRCARLHTRYRFLQYVPIPFDNDHVFKTKWLHCGRKEYLHQSNVVLSQLRPWMLSKAVLAISIWPINERV